MVDYRDISVVVSGPIIKVTNEGEELNATKAGCESIRNILPGAEIILSTWEDEIVEGIQYDILVRSVDVGGAKNEDGGNINRQICSRRAGIKAATRKYVLALRSESHIINDSFLKYWDKYTGYSNDREWKFLEKRVVIPAVMPARRAKIFHMGDWYYFGLRDDVLKLWDLPYWSEGAFNTGDDDLLYNAHRYVFTQFVKKYHPLQFEKRKDINEINRTACEKIIANNFVVTGFEQYGLDSYKYYYPKTFNWRIEQMEVCYSHCEWVELYNQYCNGNESIRRPLMEWVILYMILPVRRFLRKLKRTVKSLKYIVTSSKNKVEFDEY